MSVIHRRMYLQLPPVPSSGIEHVFINALNRYPVASALLTAAEDSPLDTKWATSIRRHCHHHDVAFLVDTTPEQAVAVEADGIHIKPDSQIYKRARQVLGNNAIIGTHSTSRHDAMVLAELGADYVAFTTQMQSMTPVDDPVPDFIAWWAETFEAPCVAWNVASAEEAAQALKSRADFIGIKKMCFDHEHGAATLAAIAAVLEDAS